MTVVKKDEDLLSFRGYHPDRGYEFFEFIFIVEVIISHRGRDIKPASTSSVKSEIADI